MAYRLCISVLGPGTDPNFRSHWAFAIYRDGDDFGDVLHTPVLDLERRWYQFEERSGVPLFSKTSEGHVKIASLTDDQRRAAKKVISSEPAPRDGTRRCQDWVLEAMTSLEAEELVDAGTSRWIQELVGKPAKVVAAMAGEKWVAAKR
jgi:hypothetical protein